MRREYFEHHFQQRRFLVEDAKRHADALQRPSSSSASVVAVCADRARDPTLEATQALRQRHRARGGVRGARADRRAHEGVKHAHDRGANAQQGGGGGPAHPLELLGQQSKELQNDKLGPHVDRRPRHASFPALPSPTCQE